MYILTGDDELKCLIEVKVYENVFDRMFLIDIYRIICNIFWFKCQAVHAL